MVSGRPMTYILVILFLDAGEPRTETMVFGTNAECHSTASWARAQNETVRTVCFEVREDG